MIFRSAKTKVMGIVVLILFFILENVSAQQNRRIKGQVLDELSIPIVGATIQIGGKPQRGTVTDIDGNYELELHKNEKEVVVSYVGYQRYSFEVKKGQLIYDITLKPSAIEMDEVVVVAYGAVRKQDLTGSVSSLNMNKMADELPSSNLAGFLQGRVAGVQVMQSSGAPGSEMSVQIRGAATITGNTSPLYVVDGVPMDDLSLVNPSDVENMQVLKDASSTALYGSRGTNGVVIITTKGGKKGKVNVSYNGRVDVSQIRKRLDVVNAYEYGLFQNELARTSGGFDIYGNIISSSPDVVAPERLDFYRTNSTDWQGLIFGTGVSQTHTLNIGGGTDFSNFNISGFYSNEKGIILNSGQDRYGFRINNNINISKKIKLSTRVNFSQISLDQTSHSDPSTVTSVVHNTIMTKPILGTGEAISEEDAELEGVARDNPYTTSRLKLDENIRKQFSANFGLQYNITKALSAKINANYAFNLNNRKRYSPRGTLVGNDNNGEAILNNNENNNYLLETLLNYNKTFSLKHRLDAVAGWTYEEKRNESMNITATGFANDDLSFNNIGVAQNVTSKSSNIQVRKLSSFLGRINYTLLDKYIFTLTGRYDGSSLLSETNRWKFFPSGAFAWRVNQEDFLRDVTWLTNLKLKGSYGKTGSQNIEYGAPLWGMNTINYSVNGIPVSGIITNSMANPELTWEETEQANISMEWGFINNRYRVSFDLYNRRTSGLLFAFPLPQSSGFGSMPLNLGVIRNRGLEIEAGADILTGKVKWSVSGNISFDRNKVIDLENNQISGNNFLAGGGALNQPIHITKEGYPIGAYFGYVVDGVYQNAAEVAMAPMDAVDKIAPGSLKYVDISGPDGLPDGLIDSNDMTVLGNYSPNFEYGINTDISYKRFSLNILLQGRQGGQIANLNRFKLDAFNGKSALSSAAWNGRWTGEGTSNFYPVVDGSKTNLFFASRFSNFFLEDASFLRLKNVTLSYDFPTSKIKEISSIRIYMTGSNLLTLTGYSGYDPEIGIKASPFARGVDFAVYPMTRSFSFGLNIGF